MVYSCVYADVWFHFLPPYDPDTRGEGREYRSSSLEYTYLNTSVFSRYTVFLGLPCMNNFPEMPFYCQMLVTILSIYRAFDVPCIFSSRDNDYCSIYHC